MRDAKNSYTQKIIEKNLIFAYSLRESNFQVRKYQIFILHADISKKS